MVTSGQARPLRATGQPYRGINVFLLWIEAQASGFVSPSWMTYKQAQALGAQVRKGEHGATVVYYGDSTRTVHDDASGEDREQGFRFLKTYTVFNVAQIEGLPERCHIMPEPAPDVERIEAAEAFFASIPATVNHGGDRAYYIPSADRIQLPPFAAFHDAHGYYATRGHETVHWTRHESRLNRSFGRESRAPITPAISQAGSRYCRTIPAPLSKPPPMPNAPLLICTNWRPQKRSRKRRRLF